MFSYYLSLLNICPNFFIAPSVYHHQSNADSTSNSGHILIPPFVVSNSHPADFLSSSLSAASRPSTLFLYCSENLLNLPTLLQMIVDHLCYHTLRILGHSFHRTFDQSKLHIFFIQWQQLIMFSVWMYKSVVGMCTMTTGLSRHT